MVVVFMLSKQWQRQTACNRWCQPADVIGQGHVETNMYTFTVSKKWMTSNVPKNEAKSSQLPSSGWLQYSSETVPPQ